MLWVRKGQNTHKIINHFSVESIQKRSCHLMICFRGLRSISSIQRWWSRTKWPMIRSLRLLPLPLRLLPFFPLSSASPFSALLLACCSGDCGLTSGDEGVVEFWALQHSTSINDIRCSGSQVATVAIPFPVLPPKSKLTVSCSPHESRTLKPVFFFFTRRPLLNWRMRA